MKLEKKQKILLTLIIIALAFLAWQLYDIFFPGEPQENITIAPETPSPTSAPTLRPTQQTALPSITTTTNINQLPPVTPLSPSTPSPIPPVTPTAATPGPIPLTTQPGPTQLTPTTMVKTTTITVPRPTAVQTNLPAGVPPPPVMRQLTIQAPMSQQQREYLRLVNRYQIVKMQRMLADEEAALYSSRAKVAEFNQQIAKITGAGLNLLGPTNLGLSIGYQLMYIDYQNGEWTATLNQGGRFFEVTTGTVLPDGTRIVNISQRGVVVRKYNRYYLLNFYGTILLKTAPIQIQSIPITTKSMIVPTSRLKIIKETQVITKPVIIKKSVSNIKPVATVTTKTPVTIVKTTQTVVTSPTINKEVITKQVVKKANEKISSVQMNTVVRHEQKPQTLTGIPATQPTPVSSIPTKTLPTQPAAPTQTIVKKEVPLTTQQKNTVNQLESYLESNKKPSPEESYSVDEKHLLTLPQEYYTLQLIGSYKLSDLVNFIKVHHLKDKAFTFHTYYMDKDWYVLIYGVYKTQDEAFNAIKTLPAKVQRLRPWVRTIESVSEAIKLTPKQSG